MGIGQAVSQSAVAFTTPLIALAFDTLHTYVPAFGVIAIFLVIGVSLIFIMFRSHTRMRAIGSAKPSVTDI
jgi:hypothetical protein